MSMDVEGVEIQARAFVFANVIEANMYSFDKVNKRFKSDTAVVLVLDGYEDKVTGTDSSTGKTWLEIAKARIESAQGKDV